MPAAYLPFLHPHPTTAPPPVMGNTESSTCKSEELQMLVSSLLLAAANSKSKNSDVISQPANCPENEDSYKEMNDEWRS